MGPPWFRQGIASARCVVGRRADDLAHHPEDRRRSCGWPGRPSTPRPPRCGSTGPSHVHRQRRRQEQRWWRPSPCCTIRSGCPGTSARLHPSSRRTNVAHRRGHATTTPPIARLDEAPGGSHRSVRLDPASAKPGQSTRSRRCCRLGRTVRQPARPAARSWSATWLTPSKRRGVIGLLWRSASI